MSTLIFGDSITHGCYDTENGGWAERLKLEFWKDNKKERGEYFQGDDLYNFGIDGDFATGILNRFDTQANFVLYGISRIIFAIGINDSVSYQNGDVKFKEGEFTKNLEDLVDKAWKYTKDITFIGLTKVDESITNPLKQSKGGKSYANQRIQVFDQIIQDVSARNNLKYIHLFDILEKEDLSDGLHPNSGGHKKIFEKVYFEIFKKEYN